MRVNFSMEKYWEFGRFYWFENFNNTYKAMLLI